MSRFKVGDRVRVVRTQYPDNAPVGSLGTVTYAGNRGCDVRLGAGKSRVWFFYDDELAMDDATARLHAAAGDLLDALEAVTVDLDNLAKGEACDHSVGICWCGVFQDLDDARAAIAKAKGGA